MHAQAAWTEGMAFDVATASGHTLRTDALPAAGGADAGPRPKELLRAALATCTAMDVIAILRRMRQPVRAFRVRAEAEETGEHPRVFARIDLTYEVDGDGCDPERVAHAVQLSQDRYCGVSAMLRPAVDLRVAVRLNGADLPASR